MKVVMKSLVLIGMVSAVASSSFAAQVCGQLSRECLNGPECVAFINNNDGETKIIAANDAIEQSIESLAGAEVCAEGRQTRNGLKVTEINNMISHHNL